MDKHSAAANCQGTHFLLGRTFEMIDQPGRALDAYQQVLELSEDNGCPVGEDEELERLAGDKVASLKKHDR